MRRLLTSLALLGSLTAQTRVVDGYDAMPYSLDGAMAFDEARGVAVMAIGSGRDVHEWNGTAWRAVPGGRLAFGLNGMVYDAGRQRVVHLTTEGTLEWDGQVWQLRAPLASGPSQRSGAALVYDPVHDLTVLYGGQTQRGHSAETWHWNGAAGAWTLASSASAPGPRSGHVMFYDAIRRAIVAFGGRVAGGGPSDTWQYDAASGVWTRLITAGPPGPRSNAAVAYDRANGYAILHGGSHGGRTLDDTWFWNSRAARWSPITPGDGPGARQNASMTYDPVRGEVLLYGGRDPGDPVAAETWAIDGSGWRRVADNTLPATWGSFTYDFDRERLVACGTLTDRAAVELWEWGGSSWARRRTQGGPTVEPNQGRAEAVYDPSSRTLFVTVYSNDPTGHRFETWEFDPSRNRWRLLQPALQPSLRLHSLAFDPASDRVLMFGGLSTTGIVSQTWGWDRAGQSWRQLQPGRAPTPRYRQSMVTDWDRERIVLVGQSVDVWEWDGASWSHPTPPVSPPSGDGPSITYDMHRQRTVYVRSSGSASAPIWEWDGATWTARSQLPSYERWRLVYDPIQRETMVLGRGISNYQVDTLNYGPVDAASVARFGSGCAGSRGIPTLDSEPFANPWLGDVFTLEVRRVANGASPWMLIGASDTFWNGRALPYSLSVLGLPGCSALVSVDVATPLPRSAGETTRWVATVPQDRSLLGRELHAQAFVLDPGAPNLGRAAVSDGATLRFGAR